LGGLKNYTAQYAQINDLIYTPSWASAFLNRLARAAVRVPEAKSRSKMVINVIKVVVNIFIPYLGLIVFITITYF
jgi:hypothetical protein